MTAASNYPRFPMLVRFDKRFVKRFSTSERFRDDERPISTSARGRHLLHFD
jgi:hypothetical protein